jgi:hypothetical protein
MRDYMTLLGLALMGFGSVFMLGAFTGMMMWHLKTRKQVEKLEGEVYSLRVISPTVFSSDTTSVDEPIPETHPSSGTSVPGLIQDIRPTLAFR